MNFRMIKTIIYSFLLIQSILFAQTDSIQSLNQYSLADTVKANEYFNIVFEQCISKEMKFGNITDINSLKENLRINCIPESIGSMDYSHYEDFLLERRKLMAKSIKDYYYSL